MKSDERRSHRLNYLLQAYLKNHNYQKLYAMAKKMGVSNVTARDYVDTVIIQAKSLKK